VEVGFLPERKRRGPRLLCRRDQIQKGGKENGKFQYCLAPKKLPLNSRSKEGFNPRKEQLPKEEDAPLLLRSKGRQPSFNLRRKNVSLAEGPRCLVGEDGRKGMGGEKGGVFGEKENLSGSIFVSATRERGGGVDRKPSSEARRENPEKNLSKGKRERLPGLLFRRSCQLGAGGEGETSHTEILPSRIEKRVREKTTTTEEAPLFFFSPAKEKGRSPPFSFAAKYLDKSSATYAFQ